MARWPSRDRRNEVLSQVRRFLAAGNGHGAVNRVIVYALEPAAAYRRRYRHEGEDVIQAADSILADAELAATLFALASQWHQHQPAWHGSPVELFNATLKNAGEADSD